MRAPASDGEQGKGKAPLPVAWKGTLKFTGPARTVTPGMGSGSVALLQA